MQHLASSLLAVLALHSGAALAQAGAATAAQAAMPAGTTGLTLPQEQRWRADEVME